MEFKKSVTNKGTDCLIVDGYKFSKFRTLKDGNISWRCVNKKCGAFVKSDPTVVEIFTGIVQHKNHEQLSSRKIDHDHIKNECKRKAKEDLSLKPSKIIRSQLIKEANAETSVEQTDLKKTQKAIYNARRSIIPALPKSARRTIEQLRNLQCKTNLNEDFCFIEPIAGIVIFTCESNLNFLRQNSTVVLADGTFYTCPPFFYQLYVIHVYVPDQYIQVAFCLLPSKSAQCYLNMWSFLFSLCGENFSPTTLLLDFELAAHQGFRAVFPVSVIMCCRFHLGQSWFRKICSLHLKQEYQNDTENGKWLKMFFGLPFLEPNQVIDAFCFLESTRPQDMRLQLFSDYVRDNYILLCQFPPEMWAAPPQEQHIRSTNACESFHSHFRQEFYRAHPNIHIFIETLRLIQAETYIKLKGPFSREISHEELEKIDYLLLAYSALRNNDISMEKYLKKVGFKFAATELH